MTTKISENIPRMELTHWGVNNIALLLQTAFSNWFSLNENYHIVTQISLKFVLEGAIGGMSTSVPVIDKFCQVTNHYPEPVLIKIYDAIWCRQSW